MDTGTGRPKKGRWDWLPEAMPGVARLMAEKRRLHGAAHVAECWRRSMAGEPGWFFAREGAIAIGTPSVDDPALANFAAQAIPGGAALLVIGKPGQAGTETSREGAADGTH